MADPQRPRINATPNGDQEVDNIRPHQGPTDFRLAFLHAVHRISFASGIRVERIYGQESKFFPGTILAPWVPLCRIAPELACSEFEFQMGNNPMHELELRGLVQTECRRIGIAALESTRRKWPFDYSYRTSFGERVRVCFTAGWAIVLLPDRFPKGTRRIPVAAKTLLDNELSRSGAMTETSHWGRAIGPLCAAVRLDVDQKHYKLTPLGYQTMFPWPAPIPAPAIEQSRWKIELLRRLNPTEAMVVRIAFQYPGLTGAKIAARIAGQSLNSTFKSLLAGMVRSGILVTRGKGYRISENLSETVCEWLPPGRESGPSPD